MNMTTYSTNPGRINKVKGEVLAHAVSVECLGITGNNKKMPRNSGDNVIFARFIPFGGTNADANSQNRPRANPNEHITTEGVTPKSDQLTRVDVSVALEQYACLYAVSDKNVDLHEDDFPAEMKIQVGERMGLVREMIHYGAMKGGTNKFYAGGASRDTVSAPITLPLLRQITRNLHSNHGKMITRMLAPSENVSTSGIEASWLVFCHTNNEADIRDLPGFIPCIKYGTKKPVHEMEVGSVERFRFIVSPELFPYEDAATSSTAAADGLDSTGGTFSDVYPMIVVAQDAWGDVALRGANSFDVTWLPPSQKDSGNPLGQVGYAGAKFYSASVLLNEGWMAVAEVGVSELV